MCVCVDVVVVVVLFAIVFVLTQKSTLSFGVKKNFFFIFFSVFLSTVTVLVVWFCAYGILQF